MIRITKNPRTFIYGFDRQETDIMQYEHLFTDNIYNFEKLISGMEYPREWLDECVKLVIADMDFSKTLTNCLCMMLEMRSETTISCMNFVSWPMKLVYDFQTICTEQLKLDLEVLKKYNIYSQAEFVYRVQCKTNPY